MTDRRTFLSMLAGAAVAPGLAWAQQRSSGKLVVYASAGPELSWYDADVARATMVRRGSVRCPANVQYVWPHASKQYLYATSSDSASGIGGVVGRNHHATAFAVDQATGALIAHGQPVLLPSRPIHNATDRRSQYLLTAYNNPSGVTVHRINGDGTIGEEVRQPAPVDAGIFAHQVLLSPNNRMAVIVARGNDGTANRKEDPGALKVYQFRDGLLTNGVTVAPGDGYGFGARHIDFHPTRPWVFVSVERQNKLMMFRMDGDRIEPAPAYTRELLADPHTGAPRQLGGTVHVHPNGGVVYGINRADHRIEYQGRRVFGGGENSIAVFALDRVSGEPTLIQHIGSHGFHPRTFHIDPTGRMLVAAHITPMDVRDASGIMTVPATMAVFRIEQDGKLSYMRRYDVDVGKAFLWWMGMVQL